MASRLKIVTALAVALSSPALADAAPGGVQWAPDGAHILVNKDVNDERWAISMTLADVSSTGNVFFTDSDRSPAFIWCEKKGHEFDSSVGEITLQYRCLGSDRAVGGFSIDDWDLISDTVFLPMSFFVPDAETCDLHDAVNGSNADDATSSWDCVGNAGTYQLQVFSDGTGVSTEIGAFEFDVIDQACSFGQIEDNSFLDMEYSPSRDLLTVYEIPAAVDRVILSECRRVDL